MKRLFDTVVVLLSLVVILPVTFITAFLVLIYHDKPVLFSQVRPGKGAKPFKMYKFRSMTNAVDQEGKLLPNDQRMTKFGAFLRSSSLDELPELYNVLKGDMSLVGPRPDVQGYADLRTGEDRIILSVKPGITGPATLKYRNEEEILINKVDPKRYNDEVIWKDKIRINKMYVKNWIFFKDLKYIYHTIFS